MASGMSNFISSSNLKLTAKENTQLEAKGRGGWPLASNRSGWSFGFFRRGLLDRDRALLAQLLCRLLSSPGHGASAGTLRPGFDRECQLGHEAARLSGLSTAFTARERATARGNRLVRRSVSSNALECGKRSRSDAVRNRRPVFDGAARGAALSEPFSLRWGGTWASSFSGRTEFAEAQGTECGAGALRNSNIKRARQAWASSSQY
jgi:hypothetical protein